MTTTLSFRELANHASLLALADKYAVLGRLRDERARGEPLPPRKVFRDLASQFPGALKELDRLTIEEIRAREASLRDVVARALEPQAWMIAVSLYHRAFREALEARHHIDADAHELAVEARERSGLPIDEAFMLAARKPPHGRIAQMVIAHVAEWCGLDHAAVATLVGIRRAMLEGARRTAGEPR